MIREFPHLLLTPNEPKGAHVEPAKGVVSLTGDR